MPRRILEGEVVSDKMDKTVTVLVERRFMHPVYKKYVKRSDRYAAHDEGNVFKIGDRVQIEECRPLSKRKTWTVITAGASAPKKEAVKGTAPAAKEKPAAAPVAKATAKKPAATKKTAAKKASTAKKKDA